MKEEIMLKKIQSIGQKYVDKLLLSDWDISFELSKDMTNGENSAAEVHSSHIYKWAKVKIYRCAFEKDNNIDHIIKHELCHCMTDPLYKICYDLLNAKFRTHHEIEEKREILTEWIAKVIK